MAEDQVIAAPPQQDTLTGDPPSGPDYVSKVYTTLKDNISGFDKDEATFRKLMGDSSYRAKVYSTLKENIDGFNKGRDQFDSAVGVLRPKPGQPIGQLAAGEKPIDSVAGLLEKTGVKTAQQAHADELAAAKDRLTKTWDNITPLAEKTLQEDRQKDALGQEQAMLQRLGSDATRVAGGQPAVPFPAIAPTTPQDVQQFKNDEGNQRRLLSRQITAYQKEGNQKDANELQAAAFITQKQPASKGREDEALSYANDLKEGKLRYSPVTETLIKPTNLGESLTDAWGKRQDDIALYDVMNDGTDAEKIAALNKAIAPHDPLKPIHVPEGVAGFIGGEAGSLGLPGLAATAAGFIPAVGTAAAGGIMAHEQARRSAAGEAVKTYAEAKAKGATDEEALDAAKKGATVGMYTGAITGGLMGAAGAKAGKAALATPAPSGMLRAAAAKAFSFLKEEAPAALTQGAIAGTGEAVKNIAAGRPTAEGVAEAGLGAIGYTYAFGALAKLGRAIPKTAEKLRQGLIKLPPEDVKAIADEQVQAGIVTPDEAKIAVDNVEAHRAADEQIPDKVVNDEVRLKLQKRMERRAELEDELKTVNKAFHLEIKEKIAKLDEEVNEVANSKEAKTEHEEPGPEEVVNIPAGWNSDITSTKEALRNVPDDAFTEMRDGLHDVGMGQIGTIAKLYHKGDRPDIVRAVNDLVGKYVKAPVEPAVPRGTPEGQADASATMPDARILIEKGIESGKISDVYKPYAEHPEHFLDFIRDQIKGGNEPELRKEFGDDLVNLAKEDSNAQAVRSDPGQVPEGGQVVEGGKDIGSEDLQSPALNAPVNGEAPEQAGERVKSPEPATLRPPKVAKPAAPILTPEQQAQADYAYKNSYREFVKEHPDVSVDDYNRLRGAKFAQVRAAQTSAKHEQLYENIMGSDPQASGNRIPVDPIVGEKPKQISQIMSDVSKGLSQKIIYAKSGRKGGVGTYSTGSGGIKIKYTGDLDTTAHEIGHGIDDKFGVLANIPPAVENELLSFSRTGSTPPTGHPNPKQYTNAEGFAEWLRAYVVNPEIAKGAAPETYKLYNEKVSEGAKKTIESFSNDFRTLAGASGRDATLANIQWEGANKESIVRRAKGLMKEVFSKSDPDDMFAVSWADKVSANMWKPLRVPEKAFEYAKGLKGLDEVLPENDFNILSRLFLSIDGKFGEYLKNGLRDGRDNLRLSSDGQPMTLDWLLGSLDNTDPATIQRDMEDVAAYMVNQRTIELSNRFGRDSNLTGIGAGIYKDLDVALKGIKEAKSDPVRFNRIEKSAKRYREFADGVLKYLVDKGRISKEGYDAIKTENAHYVGMQRVVEGAPEQEIISATPQGAGGKIGSKGEPIKSIKGSSKTIINPYTTLLDGLYKGVKEADRNEVMQAFNDMLRSDRTMYQGKVESFADVGQLGSPGDKNVIVSFNKGKAEHWIYHPEVYKALKGLDHDAYKLPGAASIVARIIRSTVTKNPAFFVRNIIRDTVERMLKTTVKSGVRDFIGDKAHWDDVARMGGLNSGHYMHNREAYYGLMEHAINKVSKNKNRLVVLNPTNLWHAYEHILEKGETLNRVAEYRAGLRAAKAKGMDDYNASLSAAFKARDLMDFGVAGHYMKILNQVIPFSNAKVQGWRSSIASAKQRPLAFAAKTMIGLTIPTAAAWMWNHRTKEDGDEYESLPAYQKDLFWNTKLGADNWLSIPKPYELGLFSSGVDRAMSKALWGNKDAMKGYAGSVLAAGSLIDEASIAGAIPGLQEGFNYDAFRNKNIVPESENALDLSLRHTETASRLGQAMQSGSQWISGFWGGDGIDARKWDHFLKAQFAFAGQTAEKLSDIGSGNSRNEFGLNDIGIFKNSPGYNSPAVQDAIEFAKRWKLTQSRAYRELNSMIKDYFDTKDSEEKDRAAKELIEFSKRLLSDWQASGIDKVQQGKFKVKQEREAASKSK